MRSSMQDVRGGGQGGIALYMGESSRAPDRCEEVRPSRTLLGLQARPNQPLDLLRLGSHFCNNPAANDSPTVSLRTTLPMRAQLLLWRPTAAAAALFLSSSSSRFLLVHSSFTSSYSSSSVAPKFRKNNSRGVSSSTSYNNNSASMYAPVVICGPSGVGKGTLIELLMQKFPSQFGFSVSHTTRPPRPGEENGVHYHFTTVPDIQRDIAEQKFIEHAEVHGKYYGTSIQAVESVQQNSKICVLDIDVQGVRNVKQSHLDPHYIFIAPPSPAALEERLRGRGTETEAALQTRLANAAAELEYGNTAGNFDRVFVNANLDACFESMVEQFLTWYPHLALQEAVCMVEEETADKKNCTCVVS